MKAVAGPLVVGLSLLASLGVNAWAVGGATPSAEPDLCKDDGTNFWQLRMGDPSNEVALPVPSQAGIDALRDGKMVNLGIPFGSPDAHLHRVAAGWMGVGTPARVWVFPDTADPAGDTSMVVRNATADEGRWVEAGDASPSPMEGLGYTPAEAEQWHRVAGSGDAKRMSEMLAVLRTKLEGRSNAELEAALAALLQRK